MTDSANDRWEAGKNDHKALSNAAAPYYDKLYANANFATSAYMAKEEEVIKQVARMTADRAIGLDLGSGTGRDSVVMAPYFEQVFGYDFSEGMINEAVQRRLQHRHGNTTFKLLDLELEGLPHQDATVGSVNTGFGMGSFLKSPSDLLKEIRRVLVPQGYAIFSFYNSDSYVSKLALPWKPSLAAIPDAADECLQVTLPDEQTFRPSAKCYTVNEVKQMLKQYFDIVSIETYPSLSALMPQELFSNPLAGDLCREVDNVLATNLDIAGGHYIIAVCQKAGKLARPEPSRGYKRAFELISREGLTGEITRHAPIKTMNDAEEAISKLGVSKEQMLKSVLIARKSLDENQNSNPFAVPQMWLVVTQATRGVDFSKLAKLVNVPRSQLELAKLSLLEDYTGFVVGAIPPFAMPKNVPVIFDQRIAKLPYVWCGTGDPSQSIRIPVERVEKMAVCSYHDVSKKQGKQNQR